MRKIMQSALAIAVGGVCLFTGAVSAHADSAATSEAQQWKAKDMRPIVQALSADDAVLLQREVDEQLATTPGGVQVSANEVAYPDGGPVITFPMPGESQAPASSAAALKAQGASDTEVATIEQDAAKPASDVDWHGCPAGASDNRWYCFYEYRSFGGRRLQWNEKHCDYMDFNPWDFEGETSSWVNTGALTVKAYTESDYSGLFVIWTEKPQNMSAAANPDNAALGFTAC